MKFNPIFKKELRLGARSIKIPLAIMFYNFLSQKIAEQSPLKSFANIQILF